MRGIPEEWVECELENCIWVLDNLRKPINNKTRQLRITGKKAIDLYPYYGATGEIGKIDDYLFEGEYIALGEDGVPFLNQIKKKAFLISGKTWVNNHAHVIDAKNSITTNNYVLYFLNQFDYNGYVNGGTRLKLTQANMRRIPFLLPPFSEQNEIVTRLERLLGQVDGIKKRIDGIPAILKRFRQSVLSAAVSGKLTEEWRGTEELVGWENYTLSEVSNSISDGDHQAPPRAVEGIPFLVISNMSSGKIEFEKVTRWVPEEYYNSLKDIRIPKRNDILFTVTGSFGIPVKVDNDNRFCFQRHIAIIKPNTKIVDSNFLFFILGTLDIYKQAEMIATGTAQKTIPLTGLRKIKINKPPIEEQKEIVKRVESYFALADSLESKIKEAQKRVDHLTQSILAKAFCGDLTREWRELNRDLITGDNSAFALLERIKEERETLKTKTGKKPLKKKDGDKVLVAAESGVSYG